MILFKKGWSHILTSYGWIGFGANQDLEIRIWKLRVDLGEIW
jgi:hypothetical protein